VGLVALPALVLSGCDIVSPLKGGVGTAKVKINATFTGNGTEQPGTTFAPGPNGTTLVQNKTIKGTFTATLPKKIDPTPPKPKAAAAGGGIKIATGTFIARSSGAFNPATNSATLSGVQVLKFDQGLGEACMKLETTVTNGGANETGTFTLVGGTKIAGKARFAGTYSGSQGPTGFTGTLNGKGKLGKSLRPHNADCKAIRGL
jgi:hypothetical protein